MKRFLHVGPMGPSGPSGPSGPTRQSLRRAALALVVCGLMIGLTAHATQQRLVISGRVIDMDGGAAPGVDVRLEAATGVSQATRTDQAGRFSLAAGEGAYRLVARLQGFRTRTWLKVHPGEVGDMSIQIVNHCDEVPTGTAVAHVIDANGAPIGDAFVTSLCGSCWTIFNGVCSVTVPNFSSGIWASHRDYQPGRVEFGLVTLARRTPAVIRTTLPTVQIVTAWTTWSMELAGRETLVAKFLADVSTRWFEDWIAYLDGGHTTLKFGMRGHQWKISIVSASQVRVSLPGETDEIDGRIVDGRVGDGFNAPNEFAPAVPVLEVTRVR